MKKWILTLVAVFSGVTQAAGTVDFLEVDNDVVLFSTSEVKATNSPACVTAENANKWSISLATQSGRANYTMLVTALSMGIEVNVETAGDCADMAGLERATRIWFVSQG